MNGLEIGTGQCTVTELFPGTTYEVYIDLWNGYEYNVKNNGETFTTLPDFTSWQPTPSSTDITKATVSGSYAGNSAITVVETSDPIYSPSYKIDSGSTQSGADTGFISMNSLDHTIAFTTNRISVPDTGFFAGNLQGMYVLLLLPAITTGIAVFSRYAKRKRRAAR